MDEIRHYPVFFECRVLLAEERKGIEKYFSIRRRSGGGDCGPLRSVRDQVCSIAFRYQKDQQKVLQKREHVVELAGGPLAFTVRATLDPHTPAAAQSIPASTPPSSGEEYDLRPDVYLLRYLKECPEAGEELERELASVAYSAQLYPEERRVLVKRLAQPGAVDEAPNTRRIVLFGKTGAGKSSLANTIFGEELLLTNHTLNSEPTKCQAKTKSINGRGITLIDNPGLFDPGRSEEDMKTDTPDTLRCITECAPGPHAFLIVLKVEKFTEHEKEVITQMCEHFSEDTLTYAVVVFTHGDQLPEGMTIEEYVKQNEGLSDLVKKCGRRFPVVDNKYWKNDQEDEYRSNQFQVAGLLNTIEEIVMRNKGGYYTNDMLKAVEKEIQKEEVRIRQSSGNISQEEVREHLTLSWHCLKENTILGTYLNEKH